MTPGGSAAAWADACRAAALFAHHPAGLAFHLRASPGPVRDRFLDALRTLIVGPFRRCPAGIADDRLLGGLDLGATLAAGRTVIASGLLAEADGGVVVVGSAERIGRGLAARLGQVLDDGVVAAERDGTSVRQQALIGLVLVDEGDDGDEGEVAPATLLDRAAFRVRLDGIRLADAVVPSVPGRASCGPTPKAGAGVLDALCNTAEALGIASARATLLALRVAQTIALGDGRDEVSERDAAEAARLVLAPRATRLPVAREEDRNNREDEAEHASGSGDTDPADDDDAGGSLDAASTVLAAAAAALPPELLALSGGAARAAGRSGGAASRGTIRGRPLAARPGRPDGNARLALVDTLRAAAPWQRIRSSPGRQVAVRSADLRVRRFEAKSRTVSVFVVDASGSAALNRLAEAKGAVELLLAECYVRRDQVALIAFRSNEATLLLPPTGALTRAKRSLAALPGGGGTPLAAGLDEALTLGHALKRRGEAPLLVVLTDGRANVARDGSADRMRAWSDAMASAAQIRAAGLASVVIDISPRPQAAAAALAAGMGARCVALPQADATALSRVVRAAA